MIPSFDGMNISRKSRTGFAGPRKRVATLSLVVALTSAGACARAEDAPPGAEEREAASETIEQVLRRVTDDWMTVPGVAGTGLGLCDGTPCIKVFITRPRDEIDPPIPDEADGHPVRVEPSGPFRALDSVPDRF